MPGVATAAIASFGAWLGGTGGAFLIMNAAAIATGAIVLGGLALSSYQQRRAKSKMRDAYNAQQVDRFANVMTTISQRDLVLGRVRKGGGVYFRGTTGANNVTFMAHIALAGHEIDAVEQVYFDDKPVTIDGLGRVTTAPWARTNQTDPLEGSIGIAPGTTSYTVPGDVRVNWAILTYTRILGPVELDGSQLSEQVSVPVSISGNTITFPSLPVGAVNGLLGYSAVRMEYFATVRWELGSPNAVADARTIQLFPGLWTSAHRARGVAKLIVEFTYDETAFPTGAAPVVTALVRGAKVYDPRTGTTAWSDNPALLARHVYTHPFFGKAAAVTADEDARVIAAANACDTSQSWVVGGAAQVRPLYRAGLVVPYGAPARDVLDDLAQAMGGMWAFAGGELYLRAGVYTAPVMTLTDSDLAVVQRQGDSLEQDPVGISVHRERAQKINTVNLRIWDQEQDYKQVAITPVKPAALVARDGAELAQEVTLAAVSYSPQAQHIAGIMLRDARDPLTFEAPFKLRAWPLELFDTVSLTLARYGWSAKTFMVMRREWDRARGVVKLTLKETAAAIYQPDASFPAQGFAANTALPQIWNIAPPSLGEVFSGSTELQRVGNSFLTTVRVTWAAIQDASVRTDGQVQVQWAPVGSSSWQTVSVPGDSLQATLIGPQDGQLIIIRTRTRNPVAASSWTVPVTHQVVGKAEPPPDVPFILVGGSIAQWGSVAATDLAGYRLRAWSQAGTPNWTQAAPLHEGLLTATVLDLAGRLQGVTSLLVKAVDTSGNESATARSTPVPLLSTLAGNTFTSWPQAPVFGGTITNGAVSGGVLQANDSGDLFWPATGAALFWPAANGAVFWPLATYGELRYELQLQTPRAGTLAIQSAIAGAHVIEVQRDDQRSFWGLDTNEFWGADTALFWPAFTPTWQAWPGALSVQAMEPIRLRVMVNAGEQRGQITTFTPFLDVPTLTYEFTEFSVAAGGTRVPLPAGWTFVRGVTGTVVNDGGAAVTLTQEDFALSPGPLVMTRNSSGVSVAGRANGRVIGY